MKKNQMALGNGQAPIKNGSLQSKASGKTGISMDTSQTVTLMATPFCTKTMRTGNVSDTSGIRVQNMRRESGLPTRV